MIQKTLSKTHNEVQNRKLKILGINKIKSPHRLVYKLSIITITADELTLLEKGPNFKFTGQPNIISDKVEIDNLVRDIIQNSLVFLTDDVLID